VDDEKPRDVITETVVERITIVKEVDSSASNNTTKIVLGAILTLLVAFIAAASVCCMCRRRSQMIKKQVADIQASEGKDFDTSSKQNIDVVFDDIIPDETKKPQYKPNKDFLTVDQICPSVKRVGGAPNTARGISANSPRMNTNHGSTLDERSEMTSTLNSARRMISPR